MVLDLTLRMVRWRPRAVGLVAPRGSGQILPLELFHYMAAGRAILVVGGRGERHPSLMGGHALVLEHRLAIPDGAARLLEGRVPAGREQYEAPGGGAVEVVRA